jgi:6-pyruvoyltetrahydropterin/6-carboxytetrahydropterin synthase
MLVSIAKDFWWEMSHRLPFHDGPCRNIHGHTYKLRLELTGEPDNTGILMDYFLMQEIVSPVIKQFDHAFLCDSNDRLMIDFLQANDFKLAVLDKYSTSENISEFLLGEFIPKFSKYKNIRSIKVSIYETADVYASVQANI